MQACFLQACFMDKLKSLCSSVYYLPKISITDETFELCKADQWGAMVRSKDLWVTRKKLKSRLGRGEASVAESDRLTCRWTKHDRTSFAPHHSFCRAFQDIKRWKKIDAHYILKLLSWGRMCRFQKHAANTVGHSINFTKLLYRCGYTGFNLHIMVIDNLGYAIGRW